VGTAIEKKRKDRRERKTRKKTCVAPEWPYGMEKVQEFERETLYYSVGTCLWSGYGPVARQAATLTNHYVTEI